MKNLRLIIFFFVATACISQNVKIDSNRQFTIREIDSLCLRNGSYGNSDSSIEVTNKRKKIIGRGGSSISTYIHHLDEEIINNLSISEKKKYDFEKNSILIKADYHQTINYINSYSETIFTEYYYYQNEVVNLKIEIIRKENGKETTINYNLNKLELDDDKEIKNIFLIDLKKLIKEKNNTILEFYTLK
nr:hypothetical protein [uncultured Flavobacterium sp.]